MKRSAAERLRRFYGQFSGTDQVLILINADPDSIACAMAVSRLLWRKVSTTTISHINQIDRPDNLAMIRLLEVSVVPVDRIDPDKYSRIVMVDSQPNHHEKLTRFSPHVVIDHHPETGVQAPFVDVRPAYGATASMLTEYLQAAKIKPSVKLATGLFHAIKTDTSDFKGPTLMEDLRAFQFLFRHANIHLARKIELADLKIEFLKYFKAALQNLRIRKGKVFVHLGAVVSPDVCVLVADFFMRVNTVNWSIVSGICNKKLVVIFRNDGIRKNAGKVAKDSFGQIGSAGGHKNMARAEIDLTQLKSRVDPRDDRKLLRWLIQQVEKRTGKAKPEKPVMADQLGQN